ncbi:unnamed protein product [Pleuronectes platessa]|uniref:Uncharacterized protein n=1 Tax=Pleuronectes platessa TaxID=8262 RepID=A0A9N7YBP7_PLEPL|nr:unnamed protein product [Pleuronectes platessa]
MSVTPRTGGLDKSEEALHTRQPCYWPGEGGEVEGKFHASSFNTSRWFYMESVSPEEDQSGKVLNVSHSIALKVGEAWQLTLKVGEAWQLTLKVGEAWNLTLKLGEAW